ncbi:MAG: hypothetical protein AB7G23_18440 [Vicinamibacterales bacterium]
MPTPSMAVLNARLGPCSATFTVRDAEGAPLYGAIVHVRVRYGFLSLKRMDLEVGTSSEGKAMLVGLPARARPLAYDIRLGILGGVAEQDLEQTCDAAFDVRLRPGGAGDAGS